MWWYVFWAAGEFMEENIQTLKEQIVLKEKEIENIKHELNRAREQLGVSQMRADEAQKNLEKTDREHQGLRERVKRDIQQIRIKEKELEAKLEIVKRDSETLLSSKDKKLLEMKRKIDTLEFEMESLKESERGAQKKIQVWKDRIDRVLRALKLGTALLESDTEIEVESSIRRLEEEVTQESTAEISPKKSHKKVA